jgi:hypothetical protein
LTPIIGALPSTMATSESQHWSSTYAHRSHRMSRYGGHSCNLQRCSTGDSCSCNKAMQFNCCINSTHSRTHACFLLAASRDMMLHPEAACLG